VFLDWKDEGSHERAHALFSESLGAIRLLELYFEKNQELEVLEKFEAPQPGGIYIYVLASKSRRTKTFARLEGGTTGATYTMPFDVFREVELPSEIH
jgi:hypothetical protein